jgi:hypothetical protein
MIPTGGAPHGTGRKHRAAGIVPPWGAALLRQHVDDDPCFIDNLFASHAASAGVFLAALISGIMGS